MSAPAPACAWCGARTVPAGRRLLACTRCGVAITYPVPDAAELDAAYAGPYRPGSGRFSAGLDRLLARSRGALATRIDATAPPGPVLDVGCGEGWLLDALAARGRTAVGLERAPQPAGAHARSLAVSESGLEPVGARRDVVNAELTDFHEHAGEWAAVIFWHSLEHLRDARAALDHAAELLAPHGVLMVAAPNRDSWQARALGSRWLALDPPRHLTHLNAKALGSHLNGLGLEIEEVSSWRGGQVLFGWLHGLVAQLPGHLDLYDAIRRPQARQRPLSPASRTLTLALGVVLAPLAAALSGAEVLAGHGGTVFIQARRPGADASEPSDAPARAGTHA